MVRATLTLIFAVSLVHSAGYSASASLRIRQVVSTSAAPPALDFEVFRTRVQAIFLNKRQGHARCYVCHSQGTPFRLQPFSTGKGEWTDDESRRNFEAIQRLVVAGNPLASRLLTAPLAAEAGGILFHPGGKRWTSQNDPEWQMLAAWVRTESVRRPSR